MKFEVDRINAAVMILAGVKSRKAYDEALRRIAKLDPLVQLALVDSILAARRRAGL